MISLRVSNIREFPAVQGNSGAGKTTLTKLILAEEYPTGGTVFFESTDIHKLSNRDLDRLPCVRYNFQLRHQI